MTAGSASMYPVYQLARLNHATSSPALSPPSRSPRIAGVSTMPMRTHRPLSSRISELATYAVLSQEAGNSPCQRVIVLFFIINVLATSAMFTVGVWRLTELETMKRPDVKDTGSGYNSDNSITVPAIRYSLNLEASVDQNDTCQNEPLLPVSGWDDKEQGDITSSTDISYNTTDSCFHVTNRGRYIIYNQLTFRCAGIPVKIYSQGIFIKDDIGRDNIVELADSWQGTKAPYEAGKICYTSRLFAMIKLLEGNRVCVKAEPRCLLRAKSGLSFFGLYRVL